MRKIKIVEQEYYHIINRGNNKQLIFKDDRDRIRFLFLILFLQSSATIYNISRQVKYFEKNKLFKVSDDVLNGIIRNREVELIAFVLMPNHFHLVVRELKAGGISQYMQRVSGAHARYFNIKHSNSGHLFQAPFQIVHIKDDNQLLYLSAYVHRNPREIKEWTNKEYLYPWSSYQDFVGENRWGELLKPDIILDQFSSKEKYKSFVESSGAKDKKC